MHETPQSRITYGMEGDIQDTERLPLFTTIETISRRCAAIMLVWFPVLLTFLPLYLLGLSTWGLPPIISPWSRFVKYFIAVFTAGKSDDNVPFTNRVSMFLIVLRTFLKAPLTGVCWFIDELLFSNYHKVGIEEPIFLITGCRTGSTQLAHYLEDDKTNFIAPTIGESMFPFIWYWKLVVPVLSFTGINKKHAKTANQPQSEFQKRHNANMLRTGSFEICAAIWHFSL